MALLVALSVLAAVGLAISSYFTAVAFRWIRANETWIPPFCRMEDRTCASIVFTPQARVFGPPNSLPGQLFYVTLFAGVALGWLEHAPVLGLYVAVSAVTVGLAVYLSYQLIYVIRVPCKLCFTSHGINVVILGLLLVQAWSS